MAALFWLCSGELFEHFMQREYVALFTTKRENAAMNDDYSAISASRAEEEKMLCVLSGGLRGELDLEGPYLPPIIEYQISLGSTGAEKEK